MAEQSPPSRSWKSCLPYRLGRGTPPFSIDQIPEFTGKVAIVTGANTGLGYLTRLAFASRGAHVFLACRRRTATAEIQSGYAKDTIDISSSSSSSSSPPLPPPSPPPPTPKLEFLELDLKDINKTY
ncbi:MAG: hypothetical protein J3R72DRAFT_488558 [Linnemannia gamsii]|nr:MAG: hypothetical protein J3R72DRAFT_488558 [Linnemannia gamsii]